MQQASCIQLGVHPPHNYIQFQFNCKTYATKLCDVKLLVKLSESDVVAAECMYHKYDEDTH